MAETDDSTHKLFGLYQELVSKGNISSEKYQVIQEINRFITETPDLEDARLRVQRLPLKLIVGPIVDLARLEHPFSYVALRCVALLASSPTSHMYLVHYGAIEFVVQILGGAARGASTQLLSSVALQNERDALHTFKVQLALCFLRALLGNQKNVIRMAEAGAATALLVLLDAGEHTKTWATRRTVLDLLKALMSTVVGRCELEDKNDLDTVLTNLMSRDVTTQEEHVITVIRREIEMWKKVAAVRLKSSWARQQQQEEALKKQRTGRVISSIKSRT